MENKFEAGHQVQYIDGGRTMRVEVVAKAIDGRYFYSCSWIECDTPRTAHFAEVNLKAAQPRIGGPERANPPRIN